VTLTVLMLRTLPFETANIERYRRREMYLARKIIRRVENNSAGLWGTRDSLLMVSELIQKTDISISFAENASSCRNRVRATDIAR
jgi:hypothetical protein